MTKLEEVLDENWEHEGGRLLVAGFASAGGVPYGNFAYDGGEVRAAVAVLGKRALALVLKHEWSGRGGNDDNAYAVCPECEGLEPDEEQLEDYRSAYPLHDLAGEIGHKPGSTQSCFHVGRETGSPSSATPTF